MEAHDIGSFGTREPIRRPLTAMLGVDSNLRALRTLVQHGCMLAA
jgi:hypothetical protein